MSYHIYTTRGVVLSERPMREADRIYTILTRDLGLIRATATGVRKEVSKLRGNIEPFSLASISFVKGKEFWRLTSAQLLKNISVSPGVARPLSLIEKLVQGEDPHQELFDAVEDAVLSVCQPATLTRFDDEMFEVRLVAKILFHLGYLDKADLDLDKKEMIQAINRGIEASNLVV
ncbi:MAG: recombination protein O N-terminal domain-containing protein [Parcubacteria group bacterium]